MTEQVSFQGEFHTDATFDLLAAIYQQSSDMVLWPYGKRWFLPKWTLRNGLVEGAMLSDGSGEMAIQFSSSKPKVEVDNRIHARLLRFGWIRLWIPLRRLVRGAA